MTPYTFVTVAHDTDFLLLKLQARSFRLHMPPEMVGRIILVQNPGPYDWWGEGLAEEYGELSRLVEIVTASDLGVSSTATGWWTQQVCKLQVARMVPASRYMVLDAKNHWVFAPTPEFFETPGGKPRLRRYGYRNHPLREKLERTVRYFGLDPAPLIDNFVTTATPFIFWRDWVMEMMGAVSRREGKPFGAAFIDRQLTEFFGYAGFLLQCGCRLEGFYDFGQPPTPCVWPMAADALGCLRVIGESEAGELPLFGAHRGAIHKLDEVGGQVIAQFWRRRGLFPSIDAGAKFLREQAARAS